MEKYISYLRVSTNKQKSSGLGLEAQRNSVKHFVGSNGNIVSEFVEVESGTKNQRNELLKALAACKENGATLLVAKLDRLSRNASFILSLRDSGVNFKCCDLPELNSLTVSIFAGLAQYEQELISKRTRDALQALKRNGKKLGSSGKENAIKGKMSEKGAVAIQLKANTNENSIKAFALIESLRKNGLNWNQIANRLNDSGFKTPRNKTFQAVSVQLVFKRFST